jgi:hypothetical protein
VTLQKPTVSDFNTFARNVNSQFGEDGIIEEILSRIHKSATFRNGYCVEFGAWDGKHLSNTYNLIANRNYHAVLIEADPSKFNLLCKTLPQPSVTKLNAFVTSEGDTTLDELLSHTDIPIDFDLLSIDIDGNDYYILKSLRKYRPKLICIEFNPTVPNDVDFIQPQDFRIKRGSGPGPIASLASYMGYAPVASTQCNLFLLDRTLINNTGLLREPTLDEVRNDSDVRVFLFCGYDGSILMSRPLNMPWHGLSISTEDIQKLPSILRRYPDDYNLVQRLCYYLFRLIRHPTEPTRSERGSARP